jgi:methionyl-tRNA formyltransferase
MKLLYFTNRDKMDDDSIAGLLQDDGHAVLRWYRRIDAELVRREGIELIVSDRPRYLIRQDVLDLLPDRVVNLHPSLLPWNRGYYPNFWSFLEGTPKGNSIHYIDADIDTGDILAQQEFHFDDQETLRTTYDIMRRGMVALFCRHWPDIAAGRCPRTRQPPGGTLHYRADFDGLFERLPLGWDTPVGEVARLGLARDRT